MSTDPERPVDPEDPTPPPEGDDPLVARLRAMRWPQADDETRERALREFRKMVDLPPGDDEAVE